MAQANKTNDGRTDDEQYEPGDRVYFPLGNGVVVHGVVKPGTPADYGYSDKYAKGKLAIETTGESDGDHVAPAHIQDEFGDAEQGALFREREARIVDTHVWAVQPGQIFREARDDELPERVVTDDE